MRQWTVDAFAEAPFEGNPACVVEPFDAWPQDAWMQALAQENNQAETAFLRRTGDPGVFDLRWFTPTVEVSLCGHATLASAHVVFEELGLQTATVAFDTRSGRLTVEKGNARNVMDFPAAASVPIDAPTELAAALGVEPVQVFSSRFLLAILANEDEVRALKPDIAALAHIGDAPVERGNVIVSAVADPGARYKVVSRFFAPAVGIPEDPATGSAHCVLAPVYAAKLGMLSLDFHQAYPGRGAHLHCEVAGDRVLISGRALTVMESRLRFEP